jgi:hypothetical protein
MFARAEGQGDDSPNYESCAVELAELRHFVEERGKEEVEADYDEGEVSGASFDEPEIGNKWGSRGGIACSVFDGWAILELDECNGEGKDLGTWWWWIAWKILQRRMATPSFRPTGRQWGGCHCRKCTGAGAG